MCQSVTKEGSWFVWFSAFDAGPYPTRDCPPELPQRFVSPVCNLRRHAYEIHGEVIRAIDNGSAAGNPKHGFVCKPLRHVANPSPSGIFRIQTVKCALK